MNTLEEKTQQLKDLLGKASNSGKIFWNIGSILSSVKKGREYQPKYPSFERYVTVELNINEKKAQGYIEIYQTFKDEEITDLMLISHLRYVSNLNKSLRIKLLESMRKLETLDSIPNESRQEKIEFSYSKTTNSPQQVVQHPKRATDRTTPLYTMDDLKSTVNIVHRLTKNPEDVSQQQFTELLQQSIQRRKDIQKLGKIRTKFGEHVNTRYFPRLKDLFEYEPTDEAGFVALFCVMFHLITDREFIFDNKKMYFNRIQLVREAFPDAKIIFTCEERNKGLPTFPQLDVEFEVASSRYLTHEHDKSDEVCDMIVCWIHDLPENELFEKPLPPILAIKELLESGKINLH